MYIVQLETVKYEFKILVEMPGKRELYERL